jgi:hypothetical protein
VAAAAMLMVVVVVLILIEAAEGNSNFEIPLHNFKNPFSCYSILEFKSFMTLGFFYFL